MRRLGLLGERQRLAMSVSGSDLYAGGYFASAGGKPANFIAKWNGSDWSALALGLSAFAYPASFALAASGRNIFVGGQFTSAGGNPASSVAKWDGDTWSPLDSGVDGYVTALSGADLYVGGMITLAGGKRSLYLGRAYLPALPTLSILGATSSRKISSPSACRARQASARRILGLR